jgi:hypothetical protein
MAAINITISTFGDNDFVICGIFGNIDDAGENKLRGYGGGGGMMISQDRFSTNVFDDYNNNAFAFFGNSLLNVGRKFSGRCDIGNNDVRVGVVLVTDYAIGVERIIAIAPIPR